MRQDLQLKLEARTLTMALLAVLTQRWDLASFRDVGVTDSIVSA